MTFFEKYKYSHKMPDIDISSAKGDLLKEMLLYKKHEEVNHDETPLQGEFAEEPYDDYEHLQNLLIECIPDFRLRLKLHPKTRRMEFCADVNSVFDIAWYTLARMLSEQPEPEQVGKVHIANNLLNYNLPATGGPGVYPLILVSVTFIVIPLVYGCIHRRKRERRRDV